MIVRLDGCSFLVVHLWLLGVVIRSVVARRPLRIERDAEGFVGNVVLGSSKFSCCHFVISVVDPPPNSPKFSFHTEFLSFFLLLIQKIYVSYS